MASKLSNLMFSYLGQLFVTQMAKVQGYSQCTTPPRRSLRRAVEEVGRRVTTVTLSWAVREPPLQGRVFNHRLEVEEPAQILCLGLQSRLLRLSERLEQ